MQIWNMIIKKAVLNGAIVFIVLSVLSFVISKVSPYEFANCETKKLCYEVVLRGFPIALVLTLFGDSMVTNQKGYRILVLWGTVFIAICLFLAGHIYLNCLPDCWISDRIYKHKLKTVEIHEQSLVYSCGGWGDLRTVALDPFLKYWVLPTRIDTANVHELESLKYEKGL